MSMVTSITVMTVGSGHRQQVGHVIGLVEQHARFLPGPLLIAPIGVFGRYARIHIGACLLISQKIDWTLPGLQQAF